jgi:uncharacterized protein (TIRG00374 family)
MNKAFWYRLLPVTGFIILVAVVYRIGVQNILNAFRGLRYEFLLFLPLLLTALLIAQTSKWQFILWHQHVVVPFSILLRLNLTGIFYGAITPGRVGLLLKVRYLADYCKKPVSEVSSSVVIDKLIELIALSGFAAVGSVFVAQSFGIRMLFFTTLVGIILMIILFTFYSRARTKHLVVGALSLLVPRAHQERLKAHVGRFYGNVPSKISLLVPLLLTIWCWLLVWTQMFVIAKALSMNISYGLFIVIISVASLIALIPITLDGIGTREAALVVMLSAQGLCPAKALAMSLLSLLLCGHTLAVLGAVQTRFFAKVRSNPAY